MKTKKKYAVMFELPNGMKIIDSYYHYKSDAQEVANSLNFNFPCSDAIVIETKTIKTNKQ